MERKKVRFLVMDVDGTLTDGKVYIGNAGEMFKAFDIKDGYGIKEILPQIDIVPVIITARKSRILEYRGQELNIAELHQGIRDKLTCLRDILLKWSIKDKQRYTLQNVAYIGDDIFDLQCMEPIKGQGGVVACPSDAVKQVQDLADYVCQHAGGNGAVRELIDWLVRSLICY